jgi:hypothetical protein
MLLRMGMGRLLDAAQPPPHVDMDDTVVIKKGDLTKLSLHDAELSRLPNILPMHVRSEISPTVGGVGFVWHVHPHNHMRLSEVGNNSFDDKDGDGEDDNNSDELLDLTSLRTAKQIRLRRC